ncbi:B3 domain-containing protein At4g01580-like [Telopea speciosissima]|uniref:B3 domain-containing protein At4g01580-like n=1 Tax=Telopea speciosissima TaxID=54955 RepID=UPI001CC3924C|nr:B3 domain-containing protein At4g01580-like [Telopea speciosissima]
MLSHRTLSHRQSSQARRPHFFKVILEPSIRDGKLEIPVEFVRKFGGELPDVAVLEVPGGREWSIELKKIDGAVWFHNGWQGFLKHYNISAGHFLVFRYDGNSHFFVLIFNENACEIKYLHNVDTPGESNLLNKGSMLESGKRGSGVQFSLGKRPASTCDIGSTSKPSGLCRKNRMKNKDQRKMEELPYACEPNQVKKDRSKEGEDTFCMKQDEHMRKPLAERTRRSKTRQEREKAKL